MRLGTLTRFRANPHRTLIPLAAFLAVLPLLVRGPSCGHDFDFHLLSWLEAATQYVHGAYPHWAYTPAWNAGEPRFLFYPPISWTLGALLTLLPIQFAATAFVFVALTLSGFTAYALARRYAPPPGATLCAILYLANPYMLFTAYERSAFAELLAAAWLPLLFRAALPPSGYPMINAGPAQLSWAKSLPQASKQILALALPIALLWLTNAPAAVMACYALAVLTLTRLAFARQTKWGAPGLDSETWVPSTPGSSKFLALTTLAGTTLGLLLPAFYLLPAAYERRYVQITLATITGMRPQDHFLFHRMPGTTPDDLFHNDVVRTASQTSILLLTTIAILFLLLRYMSSRPQQSRVGPDSLPEVANMGAPGLAPETWGQTTIHALLPLTVLLTFLQTPPSLILWQHTPQLAFLQFPWRLNALLAVIALILAATTLRQHKPRALLTLAAATLLIYPAYSLFHQPCDATDTPKARAAHFHSPLGTEPTDEYTPATADNDALTPGDPPYSQTCLDTPPNHAPPDLKHPGRAPIHLTLRLPCDSLVVLNRRLYPTWRVTLDGQPIDALAAARDDGLITLNVPSGTHTLNLTYHRTLDQLLGIVLLALALLTSLLLWRHQRSAP